MALHIGEIAVVDPPCIVELRHLSIIYMLLPVKPPEVHALLLHRMHDLVEHVGHELLVGVDPLDAVLSCRVLSETLSKRGIALLPVVEALCWMQVDGNLETLVLHLGHEHLRIREYALVPCPSCPAATARIGVMPVHVHHEHVKRNIVRSHLIHEGAELLVRICPVARPPVAECETRRQRHLAGEDCEVLQRSLIVMTICHEIPVLALTGLSFLHPSPLRIVKQKVLGLVDQSPSVAGNDSVLKRTNLALL